MLKLSFLKYECLEYAKKYENDTSRYKITILLMQVTLLDLISKNDHKVRIMHISWIRNLYINQLWFKVWTNKFLPTTIKFWRLVTRATVHEFDVQDHKEVAGSGEKLKVVLHVTNYGRGWWKRRFGLVFREEKGGRRNGSAKRGLVVAVTSTCEDEHQ